MLKSDLTVNTEALLFVKIDDDESYNKSITFSTIKIDYQ